MFASRAAELLDTALSPERVTAHIDAGAAQLAHDIHFEENRWPSALAPQDGSSRWQSNVAAMRAWALERPERLRQELQGKFELTPR